MSLAIRGEQYPADPVNPEQELLFDSRTLEYMNADIDEYTHAFDIVSEAKEIQVVREISDNLQSFNDVQTLGHQERVALASVILMQRLGYTPEEQLVGAVIALIHDGGKATEECQVFVQSQIAFRDLPPEERIEQDRILREHPEKGAQMVRDSEWEHPSKEAVAEGIDSHHFMDGYGSQPNPDTLRHVLPMAISDNADALASERSYKVAFSYKDTRRLLYKKFSEHPDMIAAFFNEHVSSYQIGIVALHSAGRAA